MADRDEILRDTLLLINAIKKELSLGTVHYDKNGKKLNTVKEIMKALLKDKTIDFQPVESRRAEFDEIIKAYSGGKS